ncbi:uncharacterized membrane protein YkvA (DUF1232 family) [Mesorhizobium robiniae]|uniref:Uncharacterized membrane protein YkvA (DUF1232 family) n=1 Tax=Mesorhizobium robiniae TaxID=559315 RepID=A0ABV2GVS9_9HYPH
MKAWLETAKRRARDIRLDVIALWFAARDPRVPWSAKLVAGMVAAYALSPIDLIPDFIPVLGYLDDLIIVPLGVILAIKLIPPPLMDEFRARAAALERRPQSRTGMFFVVALWLALAALLIWAFWPTRAK